MEKLIQLLNEYEAERHKTSIVAEIWWQNEDRLTYLGLNNHYSELLCISKGYEFIKWLVKNNKIDFDNRELKDKFMEEIERYPTFHNNTYNRDFNVNGLLMLLAISDTPIEDLISYLK